MKKSLRIVRDVSLVVVFCIGFLGLVWLANFLQDNPDEQTSSEFSDYRVSADKAVQGNDFGATLENLRAMVRNDPYDGRAQYQLASTIFSRVTIDEYVAEEAPRLCLSKRSMSFNELKNIRGIASEASFIWPCYGLSKEMTTRRWGVSKILSMVVGLQDSA